jgi:hypothetical protein
MSHKTLCLGAHVSILHIAEKVANTLVPIRRTVKEHIIVVTTGSFAIIELSRFIA